MGYDQSEDMALAASIKAGSEPAIQTFFDQNQGRLYGFVIKRVGDPTIAEDLVEDAFIKGIFRIGTYRGKCSLSTWLHTIAKNTVSSYFRRKCARDARAPTVSLDNYTEEIDSGSKTPDTVVAREEIQRNVRQALDGAFSELNGKVGERQKAVLTLHYYAGMTYPQIAEDLGVSVDAVKSVLHRARRDISNKLKKKGVTPEMALEYLAGAA